MAIRLRARAGAAIVASLALLAAGRALPADPRPRVPYALDLPLARGRFTWSSPLAQRNDLYAVMGAADGSRIWAVGAAGTVLSLREADAKLEVSGTEMDLYAIWVAAADDVWVVGERGTILHGDGKKWARVPSGTKQALYSIWGRDAHDLWIGGNEGVVLHREGDAWRVVPAGTRGPIAGIAGCDRDAVCALTLASLLPAIDLTNRPCTDPDGDCPTDEPAEPEGDRILRWSADRWTTIPLYGGIEPRHMTSGRTALWLTDSNLVRIVRAGKLAEQPVVLPKDSYVARLNGLWARDDGDGWLVGERCADEGSSLRCDGGAIWRFDGRAASLRKEIPATPLTAVWSWAKDGAVAVGERGTIVRFDGSAWTAVSKPVTTVDLRGVWSPPMPADAHQRTAFALRTQENDDAPKPRTAELSTTAGTKLGWGVPKGGAAAPPATDGDPETWLFGDCEALRARGRPWVTYFPADCTAGAATHKILGFDSGDIWTAPGAYTPGHWNGQSWTSPPSPVNRLVDLWGARSDDVWFVGGRDVVRWDGRALTLVAPVPGLDHHEIMSVWGTDAKNVWVAAYGSDGVKLARWDGERWQIEATFRFDLPRRYLPVDGWAASNLWPLTAVDSRQVTLWGTASDDVWVAGANGIVIRYDGHRWQRVATPTRVPLLGIGGTRGRVFAVGASGTILQLVSPKK